MFQDKTAVVTGGASGIGRALCEALLGRGARVILGDIDATAADATVHALCGQGEITAMSVDVTDEKSVAAFAAAASAKAPQIDFVFNNAGVSAVGPLHATSAQTWDWLCAVNLTGMMRVIRAFTPSLLEQAGGAHLINMASSLALGPPQTATGVSAYAALKNAVIGMSEALRADLAGTGVRVSVVCPGMVQSALWDGARNRHAQFGGVEPGHGGFRKANAKGLCADVAAARILDGVATGEFYVLTHGRETKDIAYRRQADLEAAFAAFGQRYGDDA